MWSPTEISEFSDLISALHNYREVCISHLAKLSSTGLRTPDQIESLRSAISDNADLFDHMARVAPEAFGQPTDFEFPVTRSSAEFDFNDLHQLTSCLRAATRDWTSLGDLERSQTYGAVLRSLSEYVEPGATVCVPGSGLGRLAIEIASNGYITHANENSFIMIVISRIAFMREQQFRIHPWCHTLSGLDSFADSLISTVFPEGGEELIPPIELLGSEQLVLLAGGFAGFEETAIERYDAVTTCYFIDVVEDLAKTIRVIYQMLKPGGYWVNIGPMMLHHGSDAFFTTSTLEDVTVIARGLGFQIVKEERIDTTYIALPTSHIRTIYRCMLTVARK